MFINLNSTILNYFRILWKNSYKNRKYMPLDGRLIGELGTGVNKIEIEIGYEVEELVA